ncbi:MAG: site-2 protease family protein [Candidatus Howiella sp.]
MLFSLLRGNMGVVQALIYALSSLVVIFLVLPVHESAHAFTAVKLGDPTPKYQGRLTLNPFAHIDYFGALMILLFGFGWAKPVGINPRNFKNPKGGMALTAVAGPVSNLLVAFLFMLVYCALETFAASAVLSTALLYLVYFLLYVIQINVGLAVFNLLPIPPLDGSRLLTAVLPDRIYYKIMQYERFIMLGLFALLFLGVLDVPLNFLRDAVYNGLFFVAGLPFRLFQ